MSHLPDKQFLRWIHDRLELVHKEPHNIGFMHRLREIIEKTPMAPAGYKTQSAEDAVRKALAAPMQPMTAEWVATFPKVAAGMLNVFAAKIDTLSEGKTCTLPPEGWICSRPAGHDGPCAAASTQALPVQPSDDYKAWYDEAMVASNEAGYVGASAAETIRRLDAELTDALAAPTQAPAEGRKPLSDEQIDKAYRDVWSTFPSNNRLTRFARAIEREHGIGDQP